MRKTRTGRPRPAQCRRRLGVAAALTAVCLGGPTALSAAAADSAWGPVVALTPTALLSSLAPAPSVATDGVGGAAAVFAMPGTQSTWAALRPAGGPWGAAVRLGAMRELSTDGSVAMASDGTAVAAWQAQGTTGTRLRVSFRPAGGNFGPARTVATGGIVLGLQVGIDDAHRALLAYAVMDPSGHRSVLAVEVGAGRAGTPVTVSPAAQDAALPDLAVAPSGRAVLAWQDASPDPNAYDGGLAVVASTFTPASGWRPATVLDTGTDLWTASAGIDGAGRALVAWSAGPIDWAVPNRIRVATSSAAGAWTAARTVSTGPGSFVGPSVAVDPAGRAVLAWQTYLGDPSRTRIDVVRRSGPAGQLSAARAVSGGDLNPTAPTVALARDGSAGLVSWCGTLGATVAAARPAAALPGAATVFGRCQGTTPVPVSAGTLGRGATVWPMPVTGRHALQLATASLE